MLELNKSNEKLIHIDHILSKFSLNGRYYSVFLFLMFFIFLNDSLSCNNYVFTAEMTKYRCKDARFINNTCDSPSNSTAKCSEWEYDDPNSFMAEFQLACQEWKTTLVGTVHNFGYGVGLFIVGPLSDRIGRKKMIVTIGVLGSVFGVARSFSLNYWIFIVLEFLEAAFGDAYSPAYILIMEMVPQDKRVISKLFAGFGSSLGYGILSLSAWLFPYWRHLLRVIYGPAILFFFYIFLIDESPRWLFSKGRKNEAIAIIEKIAKRSKTEIDKTVLSNIYYEENHKGSFGEHLKHTFTSGIMLKRFLICLVWWTISSFVNYGLKINAVLLPGNKYINFSLFLVSDAISKILITFVLIRFRRKIPLASTFVLAAVICVSQSFVPRSLAWLTVALFLAGVMMASAFFNITYIFTSEIFPTYTRNSMHALCSALGRIGSVLAPQTPLLMVYWSNAPSFVFGCASLVAGLATMFAPDTADDALPDTVRQAEALGSKSTKKLNSFTEKDYSVNNTRLEN